MNTQDLRGDQRVAAFLLSLDKDKAAELMSHLDPEAVPSVAKAMLELDPTFTQPESVDRLYGEVARDLYTRRGVDCAPVDALNDLLNKALGAQLGGEVSQEIEGRRLAERPFARVETASAASIATALSEETPPIVAVTLAHMTPAVAAEVLGRMDETRGLEIVQRMANLEPIQPGTLASLATHLEERVGSLEETHLTDGPARVQSIAEMLNFTRQDIERSILEHLEKEDEEMAAQIRENMFTWADLGDVDKRSMQKILASVDTHTLALALKACASEVEANVLSNLSSRVQEMVAEERELAGLVPMSEVLGARAEIMRAVHALIDAGEFKPSRGGEELVA
jgi:flagellar motor switch protein FliG